MFNFQDLNSLHQLARILIWPLSAAAIYTSFGIFAFGELSEENSILYKPAFALAFIGQTIICVVAVEFIDFIVHEFDSRFNAWLQPIMGIVLLTVGLLPLNSIGAASPTEEPLVSPLWTFLCLAWGFRIYLPEPGADS